MLNKIKKEVNKVKMRNKKGIEPVIATVLLIVITIVVVALVIAFVVPFIQRQMKGAEICYDARIEIKESESCYNSTHVIVKVSRGAEEFELSDIILKVITEIETRTKKISELGFDLPENPHEERTYFILREKVSNPALNITSVAVAPIVKSGTTEKTCEVTSQIAIVCCPGQKCSE